MPDEMVSADGSRGGVVQFVYEEVAVEAKDRFGGVELAGLPMQMSLLTETMLSNCCGSTNRLQRVASAPKRSEWV